MKLLYLCNETGFFASHRLPIAEEAVDRGWSVALAARDTGCAGALKDAGVETIGLDIDPTGLNPIRDLRTALQLHAVTSRMKPDLVHAITIKPVIYGGAVARWLRVPSLAISICGMGQPTGLLRILVRQMLRFPLGHPNSVTIFQNAADRRALMALCGETAMIGGSGVDLNLFRPGPRRSDDHCVVVMPARMIASKGVLDFVAAAQILRDRGVEATFALVGPVPSDNRGGISEVELNAWNAEGSVTWWGHQSDMAAVYQKADVVCLPSWGGEGVPRALQEAAACGLPIVTTDVPGCGETVLRCSAGLVVKPRSPAELADALQSMIGDPGMRRAFGANARRHAEELFSVDLVVDDHLEIYDRLLDRAARARPPQYADGDDLILFKRAAK
jgi:glycosyltransferase involved in cell wall biosynthesis